MCGIPMQKLHMEESVGRVTYTVEPELLLGLVCLGFHTLARHVPLVRSFGAGARSWIAFVRPPAYLGPNSNDLFANSLFSPIASVSCPGSAGFLVLGCSRMQNAGIL